MKTSDNWYTSVNSLESPIEQADNFSRYHSSVSPQSYCTSEFSSSTSEAEKAIRRQRARAFPFLIGSALISGFSLLGLLVFLAMQSPTPRQPKSLPPEPIAQSIDDRVIQKE